MANIDLSSTKPVRLTCCKGPKTKARYLFCGRTKPDRNSERTPCPYPSCLVHAYERDLLAEARALITEKANYPREDAYPGLEFSGPYLQRKLQERMKEQGTEEEKKIAQDLEDAQQRLQEATKQRDEAAKKADEASAIFQAREKKRFFQELPEKLQAFAKEACCYGCEGLRRGLEMFSGKRKKVHKAPDATNKPTKFRKVK